MKFKEKNLGTKIIFFLVMCVCGFLPSLFGVLFILLAISVEKRNASNLETVSYIGVENDAAIIIPASVIKERSETCGNLIIC